MKESKKTVWVNGCFDVLHLGHIRLLKYARSLGDELVVGLDSDAKIKKDKGLSRPFNNFGDRQEFLKAIKFVKRVVTFNTPAELEKAIEITQPDIMVVGSDWKGKHIVGGHHAKEIVYFERYGDYSTTKILEYEK